MFERYTDTARRVIFFARFFASELGSRCIEPEHVLQAILKEEPDLFRPWLKSDGEYEAFRVAVEGRKAGLEPIPDSVDIPLSQTSKRVLAYAVEEAERFSHREIRPTHLLTALLRESGTAAASILGQFGIEIQQVRMVFVTSVKPPASQRPETDELHRLIDELPISQLGRARELLQALQLDAGRSEPV